MKIEARGESVRVSEIPALGADEAGGFRDQVRGSLTDGQKFIEVDLSDTRFLDSSGLGALIALHKTASSRQGTLRVINPRPQVRQLLELTRMHRVFEILKL
jgi:anti-sigma B factor antagonist